MGDKPKKADREKTWEKVQMKAFTAWVNSYLEKRGRKIENLEKDMSDGTLLSEFLEIVCEKKFKNITKGTDILRVHKIQNVNIVLKFIQEELGVKLVSLGAEDIVDGNLKLLLGLLWSLFRRLRIQTISEEDKSSEEGLLLWVKKITEGYDGVHIDKFNNSFADGLALLAMINAYDPSFVDYDSIDHNDKEGNLNKAFELAETKMGIPKLLEASDLLEGNPDERSVILYISLFFHAFVQNEEIKKRNEERDKEKKEREKKMTDLQSQLNQTSETLNEIERERQQLLNQSDNLSTQLSAKDKALKDLEDKNHDLLLQLEELKKRASADRDRNSAKANFLEDKVKMLNKVLEDNEEEKADIEEKGRQLQKELEAQKQANQEMVSKQEQILQDVKSTQSKLEDEAKKRTRMKAEVEELKKKVGKEVEKRRQKSKALAELQKEIQALRKRAIVEGKARRGLDVLKKNLEEHLEDMYQWRDLHQLDLDGDKLDFNLDEVLKQISSKSFEDQLEILDDKLQAHNKNLQRIIKLKDSHHELKEVTEKEGGLYMKLKKQKDWIKCWFVLKGNHLYYYKDESLKSEIGRCPLADSQMIALKAEKIEDPNIPVKKFFITKVTVEGQKESIYLGFGTLKEKSSWIIPLKSKIQHFTYVKAIEKINTRPDTRILALFGARDLKSCYLDNNPVPAEGVEAVTGILSLHEGLEVVSLSNAHVGDNEVKPLAEALSKWKLKSLNLSHNKLTSEGASGILKGLGSQPNEYLTDLNLSHNQIDDNALKVLTETLPNLPKLKVLNLSGNKIGDAGVKALTEALSKTPNVIPTLFLSHNQIGDAGAADIAALLKGSSTLTVVHLSHNEIGDAGAEALATSLLENSALDELDLASNKLTNKGALAFHKLLSTNKSLQSVNLSENKSIVGSEDLQPLLDTHGLFFPNLVFTRAV